MKKWLAAALLAALMLTLPVGAFAQSGQPSYLFCYVIDAGAADFQVLTDAEVLMTFRRGDATRIVSGTGALKVDDAAIVQYWGSLNENTEQQTVEVGEVTVLGTLYGKVTAIAEDGALSISTIGDDGSGGPTYLFDGESADIAVGEEGVRVGDDVEVAYLGSATDLRPGELQGMGYVHITVYGQVEDTLE